MLRVVRKDMLFNVMSSISPHPHNHALQPLKSELIEELLSSDYQKNPPSRMEKYIIVIKY